MRHFGYALAWGLSPRATAPQALQAANWHMARLWDRKAQGRPAKPDLYTRECIKNAYLAACAGAMGTAEGWLMRAGY